MKFSLSFTITIILIVIVLNLLAGVAEEKLSLRLDMTNNKVLSLSDMTIEFLSNLEDDFTIYILSDKLTFENGLRTGIINELLLNYKARAKSNIELVYVDIYTNPGILSKYQNEDISENQIIIEGKNRYQLISMSELFVDSNSEAEQKITSALSRMSVDSLKKIYLIQGHGEEYSDSFIGIIKSGVYEYNKLSLLNQDIPEDTDLIIISTPRVDFSAEEINRIDNYLNNFGNMILFYGSETLGLPNIDGYLEEWGVKFESNIIIDPARYIGNILQISPRITDIEINDNYKDFQDRYVLTPGARNIKILWESKNKREVSPLLITSNMAYAKSYDNETGLIATVEQEEDDAEGTNNVGVLVQNYDLIDKKIKIGRAIFLSSPSMINDSLMNTPNLLNNYYLADMIAKLAGAGEIIAVPSKDMSDNALITTDIGNTTLFFTIVLIPSIIILSAGILRYRHRRRL